MMSLLWKNKKEMPDRHLLIILGTTICGYLGEESELIIPEEVTYVGAQAFKNLKHIRKVSLPESVEAIGEFAFDGCESLEEINIPKQVTVLDTGVFRGCRSLKNIELPPHLIKLGGEVFGGCGITNIRIPASLCESDQWRGYGPFGENSSLRTAVLENGMEVIPKYLFFRCGELEEVKLPESVREIERYAFCGCSKLDLSVADIESVKLGYKAIEGVINFAK